MAGGGMLKKQAGLAIVIDGVPVFEGHHGTKNGRYAIKVERFVGPEEVETPQIPGGHNG